MKNTMAEDKIVADKTIATKVIEKLREDIINNRFLEESVFAIADGYCVINLTKNIVRGSMYQVINGKKYNLNEQLGLPENN